MTRRLTLILAALALVVATLGWASPVQAACTGTLWMYEGSSGTGTYKSVTLTSSLQAWSLDGNYHFVDGTWMDNRISSYRFSSSTPAGSHFQFWTGYYYAGSGNYVLKTDSLAHNMPSGFNNNVSTVAWWCG